jgi:MoaA/NifB/PqqE/SkfB family radical SAM enzyme
LSGRYKVPGGRFIAVDVFEQVLKRLTELRIVESTSVLGLYNWGEPFLHPRLGELVAITNRFEIPYAFSTNASVIPSIDRSFVNGLRMIIFSMPGFSQSSYDRIHGFRFQTVCENIETIINRARSVGYKGIFRIHYHVYQFNMSEIAQCEEFSRQLGIDLQLHYAILNHWDHLWAYVDSELPYSMLKEISQDLFCFRFRDLTPDSVESYRCPQYDLLAIDECAHVLLCCQVPKGDQYVAGNILHDGIEDIQRKRMRNDICTRCIERGMARYLNTALEFPLLRRQDRPYWAQRLFRRLRNHFG